MSVSKEHYDDLKTLILKLFDNKCSKCQNMITDIKYAHVHHIDGFHYINGSERDRSRNRIWEAIQAINSEKAEIVCKDCHAETDNYGRKEI